MEILRTVAELRRWSRENAVRRREHDRPGAHHGRAARGARFADSRGAGCSAHVVAVSIFVNPTQFGPNEDFARYPRSFEADCALAEAEGADVVFAPAVEELYPAGAATFVEVEGLSDRLDGKSRPGHFRGVATVVAKLLIAAEPDRAFFGQKDAAQVAVLRRMAADLRLATEIVVCPIVREVGWAGAQLAECLSQRRRARAGAHAQPGSAAGGGAGRFWANGARAC